MNRGIDASTLKEGDIVFHYGTYKRILLTIVTGKEHLSSDVYAIKNKTYSFTSDKWYEDMEILSNSELEEATKEEIYKRRYKGIKAVFNDQ